MNNTHEIIVSGFLQHEDSVLMLRRSDTATREPGTYELPSSIVHVGEEPSAALLRTFRHILGLSVQVTEPIRISAAEAYESSSRIHILYAVTPSESKLNVVAGEGVVYEWVSRDEVSKLQCRDDVKYAVYEGFEKSFMRSEYPNALPNNTSETILLSEAIPRLRSGQVGVLPTDTLYGLVGTVYNFATVERIFDIKKRDQEKPMIILIASLEDLDTFAVRISDAARALMREYWPGPVSIILPCEEDAKRYLHRGTRTLAFRMPDSPALRVALKHTGPIVAPSANPEGLAPARTLAEAKEYFGTEVDFYVDGGEASLNPSTIIRDIDGRIEIVRPGAVEIPDASVIPAADVNSK